MFLCLLSFDSRGFGRGLVGADGNAGAVNYGSVGDGLDDNGDGLWKDGAAEEEGIDEESEEVRSRHENGMGDFL